MGSQQTMQPTWALIQRPPNYPTVPTPGKLETIWESNSTSLYHRLSPYTDYHTTLIHGFTKEPYYYTYIDEAGKGLAALRKYDSRIFPIGSAPIDVIRVAKFLGSGRGIAFLGKQFLLQTGQAFNETRIYNPTSPIVAAGMGLALGSMRPQRNFDTSAGLIGIARTLIGNAIPDAIFGAPKVGLPPGTVPTALTLGPNETTGGKGLIRAGTAERGLAHLQAAWTPSGGGLNATFSSIAKNMFKSLFANFIPKTQSGVKARSDESAYGLMLNAGTIKFLYSGRTGEPVEFGQRWVAGGKVIRHGKYPPLARRIVARPDGGYWFIPNDQMNSQTSPDSSIGKIGYEIEKSTDEEKPGVKYGDSIGVTKDGDFASSDMMVQYGYYARNGHAYDYPTKQTDTKTVDKYNAELNKVIDNLKKVSFGLYTLDPPQNSKILSSPVNRSRDGYNQLFVTTQGQDRSRGLSPMNYPMGVMASYRDKRVVDNSVTNTPAETSLKFSTAGHFDALNTLEVLPKDKTISNSKLKNWNKWRPYDDDQIALFFYDVVNEKYIPFRAAVKGLGEASNASWEELQFIGRGDKVYSYGGFNRNLNFGIHIVISSLSELAPTWQRVNYLSTLVKPANYTTSTFAGVVNRFMVPPMVMLTLGDVYRDQPVLIQSVGVGIPDDAVWETLNEDNSKEGWSYLASYLKAPSVEHYGQLPRELEITLTLILLEKERAIVGGANFGHAPRNEDWSGWNETTVPNRGQPNKFHQSLVVDVTKK